MAGDNLDDVEPRRKSRYSGEDTRNTSPRELLGWYSYAWAAEVFVVCGIGSFIPITLEQLARDRGVLASDHITPCKVGFGTTPAFNATTMSDPLYITVKKNQCMIGFLGWEINTASFAMYTFSFSVLIQALLIITMSGAADHGRYRKTLLLSFAFTGAIATMLFLAITSKVFFLGAALAIISNASFGASFVLLNSFLPLIVRYHPTLAEKQTGEPDGGGEQEHGDSQSENDIEREEVSDEMISSESALLNGGDDVQPIKKPSTGPVSPQLQLSTKLSSRGIGVGYVGAVLVQILSIAIVKFLGSSTWSLRVVLFFVGAWWFIFTIPCIFWMRPRPGPPLQDRDGLQKKRAWLVYMGLGWISLGRTVTRARRLKDVMLFLGAWFLLSDAIATVSGTAILYAKTELNMKPAALALINVVVMVFGVIGALTWNGISRLFKLKPNHTILVCLVIFELIPLYALLSYVPAVRRLGYLGLQQPWEMYPMGAVYGLVIAGISAYCRALFGSLVPQGYEATFYALYAITDKGSSVFGPAVVGAITDATGEIKPAFFFLAALIALPFPLMYLVDVERGKHDSDSLAEELGS